MPFKGTPSFVFTLGKLQPSEASACQNRSRCVKKSFFSEDLLHLTMAVKPYSRLSLNE